MNPTPYIFTSLAVFSAYLAYIIIKFGLLPSVSESFYRLPKKWKFLFYFALLGTAIPLMIATSHWLMIVAGIGICYTGAAAGFKDDPVTHSFHFAGVFIGFPLALIYLVLIGMWFPVVFAVGASVVFWYLDKEIRILFIEVILIYTIILSLLVTFLLS